MQFADNFFNEHSSPGKWHTEPANDYETLIYFELLFLYFILKTETDAASETSCFLAIKYAERWTKSRNQNNQNSSESDWYASILGHPEYGRTGSSRWPRGTLYPQKLALTSPTIGCCSPVYSSLADSGHWVFSY
jgi:hypothetical protein